MIVELGHLALILAFLVALVQAVVPMIGAGRGWADWMRVAARARSWAAEARRSQVGTGGKGLISNGNT